MMIYLFFIEDLVYGIILFCFILLVVYYVKRFRNIWINRKLIHLSSVPAVLFYMYFFREPYVFFLFSIIFTVMLLYKHMTKDLNTWFQVDGNYGEIFFTLSYTILSIISWPNYRVFAGMVMLFMAVGDSITGIVRNRFVNRWQKHWTGSIAMLIVCILIGYILLGLHGIILGIVATAFEAQPYIDDNLTVPFSTYLIGIALELVKAI